MWRHAKCPKSLFTNVPSLYPLTRCSSSRQLLFTKTISTQQVYESNVKIGQLSRSGNIKAARHLFDKMPHRDVVTWNTILTAYWKNGLVEESKNLFKIMPKRNVVSWNSMIAACVENEKIDEAFHYFCNMPCTNTASWNAMITGFIRGHRIEEASKLFQQMPTRNVISYTALIDGYAQKGQVDRARDLFDRMPQKNTVSWTVMINGYVDSGKFDEAKEFFYRMPKKNVVAITAMITGFCKEGNVENARNLFEQICDTDRDLVSWNALIAGYAQNGNGEEALKLYLQMRANSMEPDHATFISVLTACSSLASIKGGIQIHLVVVKEGFEGKRPVCNALITMYSKCGSMHDSERVFGQIDSPNLVSWNTIIAAYAHYGQYEKVMGLFDKMGSIGLEPDSITFLNVLSSCVHAGKLKESMHMFGLMISDYRIAPRAEHYACLVNIQGRAGLLQKAYETILEMPFEADTGIWGALLASCQIYRDVRLGELAASKLIQIEPQNSATYIMLSNIYAAMGMWTEVTRVRRWMKEQGVKKQPGYSWIFVENKVHLFLVGNISHPGIDEIHLELRLISLQMKREDDSENF